MIDGTKDKDPLEVLLGKALFDILNPKADSMNTGMGKPKIQVFSSSDPELTKLLESMFTKPTKPDAGISGAWFDDIGPREQTFGEKLIGFDPTKVYPHVESETLQDFADIIDVLQAHRNAATDDAIKAIEAANFWTQKALALSKV